MSKDLVEKIADAVLYEGYILYPYRASSVKNQQRWNFGALCPESYSRAQRGTESWTMQTECLVESTTRASLTVKVRFLHLLTREVVQLVDCDSAECTHQKLENGHFKLVPSLEVNGKLFQTWQEAVERELTLPAIDLSNVVGQSIGVPFSFPANVTTELLTTESTGETAGVLVRRQQSIDGVIEVAATYFARDCYKTKIKILNITSFENAGDRSRDDALMRSFVSTHTILTIENGGFISLLDPPDSFREKAASCNNMGTYPVLVGQEGDRDCMLSSPIILYDYPQIAPESAGNLFDGTEIDEILTLRIMTLTDEEKHEMRSGDERARQILERTESLPMEQLMKMHGAMKSVK
jgi:hypothetical protein